MAKVRCVTEVPPLGAMRVALEGAGLKRTSPAKVAERVAKRSESVRTRFCRRDGRSVCIRIRAVQDDA